MSRAFPPLSTAEIETSASDWIVRRDSGLTKAEAVEFARWQAADSRHAEAVARHDQAWSLLGRPRSAGRGNEMMQALAARKVRRRRRRIGLGAAAATVILALGIFWHPWRPAALDDVTPAGAVVLMPQSRTLPDGSVVELKSGAEIAVDFSGALRRVRLTKGEALFQVAKDKSRAFVVSAGKFEVRAVGTAFAVELTGANVEVVVTEGRVAVETPRSMTNSRPEAAASSAPEFSTQVDAGNRLVVDDAGRVAPQVSTISSVEIADRLAWRAPRLEFTETPLGAAVALMNRHAKTRLVVDDLALARLPVNGLFRADNTETLIRLLEANFGVTAERVGDTITLRKAP